MAEARTMFGLKSVPIAPKEGGGITKLLRIAENYIKTHTDEDGVVSDPQVYYDAMNLLVPAGDDLRAANKMADYKNQALKLTDKINDANNSVVTFENDFQNLLVDIKSGNYREMTGLINSLAEVHLQSLTVFEDKILGEAIEKLPKGTSVPAELYNHYNDLRDKTDVLVNLRNSYLLPTEEKELAGPENPNAYGVFIQTNYQNGRIQNIDIQAVGSLDKPPTGYLKTNKTYGTIPIYLNYTVEDGKETGRLGDERYMAIKEEAEEVEGKVVSKTILKGAGGPTKFLGWNVGEFVAGILPGGETRKSYVQKGKDISLENVSFDSFSIPTNTVVKDGRGNYYWFGDNNKLMRAKDADTMKSYLKGTGQNQELVDGGYFLGTSDFVGAYYKADENGELPEISFEAAPSVQAFQVPSPTRPLLETEKFAPTFQPVSAAPVSVAKPKTPIEGAKEYIKGAGYDVEKIVEKGKTFFKGLMPK